MGASALGLNCFCDIMCGIVVSLEAEKGFNLLCRELYNGQEMHIERESSEHFGKSRCIFGILPILHYLCSITPAYAVALK